MERMTLVSTMKLTSVCTVLALAVPRSIGLEDSAIIPGCPLQPADDRSCTITDEVPLIDISALMQPAAAGYGSPRWNDTAEAVATACEEWGFFHVRLMCCDVLCCAVLCRIAPNFLLII